MKQQVTNQILLYLLTLLSLAQSNSSIDIQDTHHHHNRHQTANTQSIQGEVRVLTGPVTDQPPRSDSSLPEPDSTSDPSEGLEENGLYQRPQELEVIRLSDTSVVLRWDISHVSMDVLQFFKIQYKSTKKNSEWKTDNHQIPPTTRAYQINGLKPGNYYFIVSAVYDNDDNLPSKQLKYTLRARSKINEIEFPDKTAPKIRWNETAPDYIRFKWMYPVKERDIPYFGYLVYYRSAYSVSDYTIYNTLDENVEIAELEPDTPYEAKVVAYNLVGISDFSETITLRTKPKQNSTTTATSATTTTMSPTVTATTLEESTKITTATYEQSPSTTQYYDQVTSSSTTTMKPDETIIPNDAQTTATQIKTFSVTYVSKLFNQLMAGRDEYSLAIVYTLFFMLPLSVIVSFVICLLSCHRKRKSPPSTTNSAQIDLEINSYFINSFPGVEKDLAMINNAHHGHQGFVNNHPHIHDHA